MSFTRDSVRAYYDQNTRLFLAFSASHKAQNIHRPLWTDGAQSLDEALNVSNARILKEIESVAPTRALRRSGMRRRREFVLHLPALAGTCSRAC